jgi:hypothetical protein
MSLQAAMLLLMAAVITLAGCQRGGEDKSDAAARTAHPAQADTTTSVAIAESGPLMLQQGFSAADSVESLRRRYGEEALAVGDIPAGEGTTERGAILFPDDSSLRAELLFHDDQALKRLRAVVVSDADSRWQLAPGIAIGSSAQRVRDRNGGPFLFSGFGWDYAGTIVDWQGGVLQSRSGQPRAMVRLQIHPAVEPVSGQDHPVGDGSFSSDDPRWKDLPMIVREIGLRF